MTPDEVVRQQLVNMLTVRQAHMSFEDALKDFPEAHINTKVPHAEYTFWHILEHLRICQWDILDYIRNPNYTYANWPDDYWPARDATTDKAGWDHSVQQFLADRQALVDIVQDPDSDIYAQIPHGQPGHNILREINVVATHNSYHIGELGGLRQTMDLW